MTVCAYVLDCACPSYQHAPTLSEPPNTGHAYYREGRSEQLLRRLSRDLLPGRSRQTTAGEHRGIFDVQLINSSQSMWESRALNRVVNAQVFECVLICKSKA